MTIYHFRTIADMLIGAYYKSIDLPIDLAWDYIDNCQGYITYSYNPVAQKDTL